MKILHIIPIYCSEDQAKNLQTLGGGERYPFELTRFLALNDPSDEVEIMIFGNKDTTLNSEGIKINIVRGVRLFSAVNRNVSPFPLSLKFLEKISWADVVHGYHIKSDTTFLASVITKMLKKPLFLTDLGGGGGLKLFGILKTELLANKILCISEFDSKFWNVKSKTTIFGGVDLRKYTYKKKKKRYILYIGRILPHKGIDRLVEAIPKEIKLIIAGKVFNTNYLKYLKTLARNKKVSFLENPTDYELVTLYQNASCSVLPSTHLDYKGKFQRKTELFGLVVVEAMACGTPVIVSDAGSLPELVQNGYNGFIFRDGDVNDLRDKIQKIAGNKEYISRMGEHSRKLAETKYNWVTIARNVRDIYEKTLYV